MKTDTPETDDLSRGNHVVPTTFAEQLERERNEWKQKYLQQNKDLGYELLDPNGTIWSECKRLQTQLTAVTEQRDRLAEANHNLTVMLEDERKERDMYQEQADYFLEQWGETQERMFNAERGLLNSNKREFTLPYINK